MSNGFAWTGASRSTDFFDDEPLLNEKIGAEGVPDHETTIRDGHRPAQLGAARGRSLATVPG